jgi:hypothetical protein
MAIYTSKLYVDGEEDMMHAFWWLCVRTGSVRRRLWRPVRVVVDPSCRRVLVSLVLIYVSSVFVPIQTYVCDCIYMQPESMMYVQILALPSILPPTCLWLTGSTVISIDVCCLNYKVHLCLVHSLLRQAVEFNYEHVYSWETRDACKLS